MKVVLGIESSCDETAAAIYDADRGLLAHQLFSQIKTHEKFGGVVPELASRDHIVKLLPLIDAALDEAGISKHEIDGVAYTKGPGLIGALMVGASVARSFGFALDVPTVGVHHMEAHLMAALLEDNAPSYPFLALIVSGGHTMLVDVQAFGEYHVLGQTLDDAVGEAFDKTAKLIGLPYPGGPQLAKLAEQGDANRFDFPRPMVNRPGLDFSFSGIKTHAMRLVKEHGLDDQVRADICASFQAAVVDTLLIKTRRALLETELKELVVVGGVGANEHLRERFARELAHDGVDVFYPRAEFCTDNAAMVAYAGYLHLSNGVADNLTIQASARIPFE